MPAKLDPKKAEAVMLKAGLKPLEPYKTALSHWKCKCLGCGAVVNPKYNAIQQGGGGCTHCGMKKTGEASKLNVSEVNKRLNKIGLQLMGEYAGSKKKLKVRCLVCKKVTTATLQGISNKDRKDRSLGCESCARKAAGTISNEIAVTNMKDKGLLPLEPYMGYKEAWLCECLICHKNVRIARESIRRRSVQFMGCIECSKKAQSNLMISRNAKKVLLRFEARSLRLTSEYVNSSLSVDVECMKCGYKFSTTGAILGRQKYGCAQCAGNYVDPKEAENLMIQRGYKPVIPFPGAHKSWESLHVLCGNIVTPEYSSIKSGNGGCKYCAEYGFRYSKPAYLYLITNEALNAHKIGIANPAKIKKSDRLHRYQHHGWSIIKVWNLPNGKVAEEIENTVLLHLRIELKILSFLSVNEMSGQGGHTETVDADSITLLRLEKIINRVIKEKE